MEFVINKLFSLLAVFSAKRKEDKQLADDAIRAVSHALNETFLYYQRIDEGQERDREKEESLCKAWSSAAIPLRHIDRELSQICDKKSEYWLDPDSWDMKKIKDSNIGLESVRDKYRKLLEEK